MGIKKKSVKEALEYVARHSEWSGGSPVQSPVWENVARTLFEHANNPNVQVVGAVGRSIRAQKIIMNRMTGTRRAGTHPAQLDKQTVQMRDLTGGAIKDE